MANLQADVNLLVSSAEVRSVMTTSFYLESRINITPQHPITCTHFLSGWLPSQYLLHHDWTISRKVHTVKSNIVDEQVSHHTATRKANIINKSSPWIQVPAKPAQWAGARSTMLNTEAKGIIIIFFLRWYFVSSFFGIQHCCSQLRRKEMLDDVEDDVWWKPNFAQRHSAWWNIVQHGSQTSATLVSVGSATMLGDVASVWPEIKDTNGGSEN